MAALDWIVLIVCVSGIVYCALTMPRRMILTEKEWLELPEHEARKRSKREDL